MSTIVFILVIAVAVIAFLALKAKQAAPTGGDLYQAKALMTANELEFFARLVQALPDHYVFPQVALGALLQPKVKGDNKKYYQVRGTFAQKMADYVVCNRDLQVIAVVELDDKTHSTEKDAKRDAMLQQAGYQVIRWPAKQKPSPAEIQAKFGIVPGAAKPMPATV
jgi:hypothetical protein